MKVLLVRPRKVAFINSMAADYFDESSVGLVPPLGIAYVASSLESYGYKVSILDCEAQCLVEDAIRKRIEEENPDIVGVSAITINIHGALEVCRIAKNLGKVVVIGGSHMTVFPKETMSYSCIDYGICGEGEQPMLELVRALEKKSDITKIVGVIYRRNGEIIMNGIARNESIDSLPWPAYHLLPLEKYEMVNTNKMISMFTTRGCPYQCTFCFRNPILDKIRKREPVKVVDEIEFVNKDLNVKYINFVDETLTIDKRHIMAIANEILKRKLNIFYQAPTRVNHIDEEMLKLMKISGCKTLRFGVESGDENILKAMDKSITLAQTRNAFKLCKKLGIETVAYLIIGYLGETEETIKKTIKLVYEIKPDYSVFFPATPMPGTKLFDMAVEKGLVDKDYWLDFILGKTKEPLPFLFPNADEYVVRAYKEFYFNPSFITKMLFKKYTYLCFFKYVRAAVGLLKMKFSRITYFE